MNCMEARGAVGSQCSECLPCSWWYNLVENDGKKSSRSPIQQKYLTYRSVINKINVVV